MTWMISWMLATATMALGQDAPVQVAPADSDNEVVWLLEDVTSQRFVDDEASGSEFTTGTKVTVLYREGDRVRVFIGSRYGWVDSGITTAINPAPATFDLSNLPTLNDPDQSLFGTP